MAYTFDSSTGKEDLCEFIVCQGYIVKLFKKFISRIFLLTCSDLPKVTNQGQHNLAGGTV